MSTPADELPDGPAALLARARDARRHLDLDGHAAVTDMLEQRHGDDPAVALAVQAERLRDIAYSPLDDDEYRDACATISTLLLAPEADDAVRARLHLGRAGCLVRLKDSGWGVAATGDYEAAMRAFVGVDERDDAAATASMCAWSLDLMLHGLSAAADRLSEGIGLAVSNDRTVGLLTQRTRVRVWAGDLDAAVLDMTDARRLLVTAPDGPNPVTEAYLCWAEILVHATTGNRAEARAALVLGDALIGPWHDTVTGVQFEAEVADALALAGLHDDALDRLARAEARRDEDPDSVNAAELAVHGRIGDPGRALLAWADVAADPDVHEPWEYARLMLLAAQATARLGEDAGALAAGAIDRAATLGLPTMLEVREPVAFAAVLDAAVAAGSGVARARRRARVGHRIELLGTPAVRTPDGAVLVLVGQTATLTAEVAMAGAMSCDALAARLWPSEPAPSDHRARLRRLLHRTRQVAPVVERRADDVVVLAPDVVVDVDELSEAVRRCRDAGDSALRREPLRIARGLAATTSPATMHVRDDLPADLVSRLLVHLHQVHVWAADAELTVGRDDLARDELEHALGYGPDDDLTAARLARSLMSVGQRFEAARVLRVTADVLAAHGVHPSRTFVALQTQLLDDRGAS